MDRGPEAALVILVSVSGADPGAGNDTEHLIDAMEAVVAKYNRKDFRIEIAGVAYVAEMIRRNLRHDFITFTITSVALFGRRGGTSRHAFAGRGCRTWK